jgi:hypothetical protein
MNRHEGSRQFADKSTKPVRETIERGVSAAEEATKVAELNLSSSLASMRELNGKLIDMAHANTDAVFDLAYALAGAQAPSDLAAIWSAHAKRQFEMMTTHANSPPWGKNLRAEVRKPWRAASTKPSETPRSK